MNLLGLARFGLRNHIRADDMKQFRVKITVKKWHSVPQFESSAWVVLDISKPIAPEIHRALYNMPIFHEHNKRPQVFR